jgi:xylan 1,4-beta-xylosidase
MPLMTICAGRANEGLRADWQQQLKTLQQEIGFRYLRFHGLLHDDMGIYSEDSHGHPSYSFAYVDSLFDAMLASRIRPFVELSFMPSKLASGSKTVFWWHGNVTPPKDMLKWNGLIQALMEHWMQRYTPHEVEQWYFEVWNEPDLPGFWSGTEQQYLDLYKNTAETVKSACPRCRVGGPASAIRGLEARWLSYIAEEHVPADFLSTHAYGVLSQTFDANGVSHPSMGDPIDRVRDTRALLNASATPKLELHYTEWNSRYSPTNPIHDQYISAPFILEKLHQGAGLAQAMAYWTFTDIFEEDGPRLAPFHAGFGLMTLQGIRKPAYFAYKFLAQLGEQDVASNDPHSWITRKNNGSIQALIWDYSPQIPPPGVTEEVFYRGEQPAPDLAPISLRIGGLQNGLYTLKTYSVGYSHNDSYTAYLKMGSPKDLTREQLAELQQASSGAPDETRTVEVTRGKFEQTLTAHQNQCFLVTLDRLN